MFISPTVPCTRVRTTYFRILSCIRRYESTFVPSYATFESTEVLPYVYSCRNSHTAGCSGTGCMYFESTFESKLLVFGCRATVPSFRRSTTRATTLYSTFFELSSKAQLSTFEGKKLRCTRPNCGLVRNIFFSCSDVGSEDAYIVRRCLKTKLAKILKLFSFASL